MCPPQSVASNLPRCCQHRPKAVYVRPTLIPNRARLPEQLRLRPWTEGAIQLRHSFLSRCCSAWFTKAAQEASGLKSRGTEVFNSSALPHWQLAGLCHFATSASRSCRRAAEARLRTCAHGALNRQTAPAPAHAGKTQICKQRERERARERERERQTDTHALSDFACFALLALSLSLSFARVEGGGAISPPGAPPKCLGKPGEKTQRWQTGGPEEESVHMQH